MTVHGRITLGLLLLTVLTLGSAFTIIAVVLDRYQEQQLDRALLNVARAEAAEAPANHFSFSTRAGPAANDVGPLEKYGIIFDENGGVLAATHPFEGANLRIVDFSKLVDAPFDFVFAGAHYRGVLVSIPEYPGRQLLLAASRDDLDGDSRFLQRAMTIALIVSVAWLAAAVGWLVRRNMREHERIAEALHRIAAGDVAARVSGEVSTRELRKVGSDVDEIAAKLAVLVDHQRQFIAYAAHELRSPLAALHGEIQQTLRKDRTTDEYRTSFLFLHKASARLKHLAEQLLDLARAEHPPKAPGPVALPPTLADVIESLLPLAREKEVRVEFDPGECAVHAVAEDVQRICRNLLDNAIRHSPHGGLVRVETEVSDQVAIRVRDQGEGVPEDAREAVFEPFRRLPTARATAQGAGLGLAIARDLARRHGGDVRVDREPNCFVVLLPRDLSGDSIPR